MQKAAWNSASIPLLISVMRSRVGVGLFLFLGLFLFTLEETEEGIAALFLLFLFLFRFGLSLLGFLLNGLSLLSGMVEIGLGTPYDINEIFAARNRSAAGATAPACGLYFIQADYATTD